jgi:hypothetical protein
MRDKSKEQYEAEINDLFEQYAAVSGDDMDTLRKTLRYRLINTTAEYIFSKHVIIPNKEEYGEEIFNTVKYCINSFAADKGNNFVHYLRASLKSNLAKSETQHRYFNKYRGLGISAKTIGKIKKVLYQKQIFAESGKNASHEEIINWIGKSLGMETKTVKNYLDKSILLNEEEDYSDNAIQEYPGLNPFNPEELFMSAESLRETLDVFNEVFTKTQERIKPYLRLLISMKYFEAAIEAQKLQKQYPFFDYTEIALWAKEKKLPGQKDIAQKWGRTESDASRTIEKFEKKVREKLKSDE